MRRASDCSVCHLTAAPAIVEKGRLQKRTPSTSSGLRSGSPALAVIPFEYGVPEPDRASSGAAREIKTCPSSRNRDRLHSPRARLPRQGPRPRQRRRAPGQHTSGFRAGWNAPSCSCGCCCGCISDWPSATRRGRACSGTRIRSSSSFPRSRSMPQTAPCAASSRGLAC